MLHDDEPYLGCCKYDVKDSKLEWRIWLAFDQVHLQDAARSTGPLDPTLDSRHQFLITDHLNKTITKLIVKRLGNADLHTRKERAERKGNGQLIGFLNCKMYVQKLQATQTRYLFYFVLQSILNRCPIP
jgi:hypothetical protein